jgi:hypothetical protein
MASSTSDDMGIDQNRVWESANGMGRRQECRDGDPVAHLAQAKGPDEVKVPESPQIIGRFRTVQLHDLQTHARRNIHNFCRRPIHEDAHRGNRRRQGRDDLDRARGVDKTG